MKSDPEIDAATAARWPDDWARAGTQRRKKLRACYRRFMSAGADARPLCRQPEACQARGRGHCIPCHAANIGRQVQRDPEIRARMAEASRRAVATAEVRARMSASKKAADHAALAAWCPPQFHEEYYFLRRRIGVPEARAAIETRIQHAGEQVLALCTPCGRTIDNPECRGCTLIGCPLALA